MKTTTYTNPNLGQNWFYIKMANIPGMLKYYQNDVKAMLTDESMIVSAYSHSIHKLSIYENGIVVYTFISRPNLTEQLTCVQVDNLMRYLDKLGWRSVVIEWNGEESIVGCSD